MCNQVVDVPVPSATPPNSPYQSVATRSASVEDLSIQVSCDDDDDNSKTTHESFGEDDDQTQKITEDGDEQNYSYEYDDKENWIGKVKSASTRMSKFVFNGLWKRWNSVGDYQI